MPHLGHQSLTAKKCIIVVGRNSKIIDVSMQAMTITIQYMAVLFGMKMDLDLI